MKGKFTILLAIIYTLLSTIGTIPILAKNNDTVYQPPQSEAEVYNMNIDWKYLRPETAFPLADAIKSAEKNGLSFYDVNYDDSEWENVSIPHAINAVDSFDGLGADCGEYDFYRGFSFYRKHFTIPNFNDEKKVFIEFEAIRQSIYLYVNGEMVGFYEAGVNATGFDISDYINPNGDNVVAVATDNNAGGADVSNPIPTWISPIYGELSCITRETKPNSIPGDGSGITYQWNTSDFNPVQGGITGNVNLYVKGSVYQTLPLYNNLKTTGNYIYATNFDIKAKKAQITVESEIRNESGVNKNITAEVNIVDSNGICIACFSNAGTVEPAKDVDNKIMSTIPADAYEGNPVDTNAETVDVSKIVISSQVENLKFWSPDTPYLYDVYTILKDGNKILDVDKKTTGFRKIEYNINDGGLKINGEAVWLTGYAQRSTNEWAAIGVANDWLADQDMKLIKESNANFIRWMHIAPKPNAIRSGDKYGIVSICPGADRETDQKGRSWDTRVEAMRDTVIYFRNSPSILFWEAGNQSISAEHMKEMSEIIKKLDPYGERYAGSRSIGSEEQLKYAEFTGSILGKINGTYSVEQAKENMASIGKSMPIIESEHSREEAPRRVWDDFSPPDYDYRNKRTVDGSKQYGFDIYDHTMESFTVLNINNYSKYYGDRIGGQTGNNYYSGSAALCWTDSNQHVRNAGSENCRSSGRVDPIRIKKESFYAYQVMQSKKSKCYIIGHWNYPQLSDNTYNYREKVKNTEINYYEETGEWGKRNPKNKTIYVVGTPDITRMALYINGKLAAINMSAKNYFLYEFNGIDITQSGKIEAVGYNARGKAVARHEIKTAKNPYKIRLIEQTGPDGLRADGSDVMYYDVEVVDKNGNVCPLSYDKINFSIEGEGVFLGGYNSGESRAVESYGWSEENEIGADFVYAECGINRVFIRSTRNAGEIKLTASMDGLDDTAVTLNSINVITEAGLTKTSQQAFPSPKIEENEKEAVKPFIPLASVFTANKSNSRIVTTTMDKKDEYSVYVNDVEVSMNTKAYKPDDTAGVLCEIEPILNAIKSAGGTVAYEWQRTGELPDFVTEGELPMLKIMGKKRVYLTNGMTTLCINEGSETNTTNYPTLCIDRQLIPELVPILSYIDGITVETDIIKKIVNIKVKQEG